jgi:hypothetical protein
MFDHPPMKNFLIWFHARRLGIKTIHTERGILLFIPINYRLTLNDRVILRSVNHFRLGNIYETLSDIRINLIFEDGEGITKSELMNIAAKHFSIADFIDLLYDCL